ncbi:MAG: Gfo/Idh/MocA family oxidoreductase [Bacteroidetes bacterium]|nr:Gfo/Idh/MocA family oxidoreductase [Bacteroidota bacterium]
MKEFALIGVAGFIAPRHLRAIKETGNNLVAALDPFDSVGVLDSYFPNSDFFTEFERFDRHLDKLKRQGKKVDYVSICSPNYLHDSHIRFALRQGANAICEKPLVLNPWNLDALEEIEYETAGKISTILQLRLHPSIKRMKETYDNVDTLTEVDLRYVTARGNWYGHSWKGDISKSGGILSNIGIHFFDMLIWVFGKVKEISIGALDLQSASGTLLLERARVKWFLSLKENDLPSEIRSKGLRSHRSMKINSEEFEFSEGFTDLHTESYREILKGHSFGLNDARPSIELVYRIKKLYGDKNN